MMVWSPLVMSVALATGTPVETISAPVIQQVSFSPAECAAPAAPNCAAPCATGCTTGCESWSSLYEGALCDSGCPSCCSPCGRRCRPGKWNDPCKYSTGDMYPHMPYFPEVHGYYYFRPYNWVHYDQHRQALPGVDWKFPYSNARFAATEKSFIEAGKAGTADSDQVTGTGRHLPNVEAVLKAVKAKK